MSHHPLSLLRRARAASLAAAILLTASLATAQQGGQKQHSVSEKTQEAFGKLKPLQETQNYAGMLQLLDSIQVVPGSYDEALILDMKAKIYGMTNQLTKALAPWERAVQLSDQHGYFDKKSVNDIVFYLAQLYAQEGSSTKDAALQQQHFTKALTYFRRYFENTPKPTPESLMAYASVLYYRAVSNPKNVDQNLLKEARSIVEKGLTSSLKPKEGFYQLLLTLLQQQEDMAGSAEVLELLLKQQPNKKDYWATLMAIYLQLSEKSKNDPTLAREYLTRSIVTFERAQALGFLNTEKDNLNLVSLYLMANQFTKGTELLYNGMKASKIESTPNNWRLLGRYYLEANLNQQAITVLQEAAKLFPKNGEVELQLAQIYLQMEKTKEANEHAKIAAQKGNFESTKPYSVHYLIAYTAYELNNLEEAAKAIAECEKFPEAAKDQQLPKLKGVVNDALNERAAAAESKNKKDTKAAPAPKTPAPKTAKTP